MRIQCTDIRLEELRKIEKCKGMSPDIRLYIFGCAETAKMITNFIHKNSSLIVEGYVIDDAYYDRERFLGKTVYKYSEWEKIVQREDWLIMGFTGSKRAADITEKVKGNVHTAYFYFPYSANVDGTYLDTVFYEKNKQSFEKIYDLLKDELSKRTMEAFLNGCITGNVEELDKLQTEGQYFNELTRNCKTGSFVDCGAYVGDTIEGVVKFYGNAFGNIVAFEPDEDNLCKLNDRVEKLDGWDGKIQLVQKGVWSKEDTLHFSSSNSSSSINEEGEIEIRVDSIDHVLKEEQLPVSYIKMDVEGSEKEALLGAVDTIKKWKPLLAVCVYHKPEDLYALTELIMQIVGDKNYNYYLRYHGPDLRELVLYAIPEKGQE